MNRIKQSLLLGLGAGSEYYDFAIFSLFVSDINKSFFSNNSTTMYTFMVFSLAYLARPFGGYIFGVIGDLYGRKKSFLLTMIILMLSTIGLAFLPSIYVLGAYSTFFFILFRIFQGIALGGEIPSSTIFIVELSKNKNKVERYIGILYSGIVAGIVSTFFVHYILSHSSIGDYFCIELWRIAFLIGFLLTMLAYFFRKKMGRSDSFYSSSTVVQKSQLSKKHIYPSYDFYKRIVISIFVLSSISMITTQLVIFMPTYLINYLKIDNGQVSNYMLIMSVIMLPSCLLGGFVCEKFNNIKLFLFFLCIIIFLLFLFYFFIITEEKIFFLLFFIFIFYSMLPATYLVFITNFFLTDYKCRALGLSYNLSYSFFSAPVPSLTVFFLDSYQNLMIPFYFILISFFITLLGIFLFNSHRNYS